MFATEGSSENTEAYAKAFGIRPDEDSVAKHFSKHNTIPTGFAGIADDMAPMAALLCSPLSRYIVGQNIVIDGGQHRSLF